METGWMDMKNPDMTVCYSPEACNGHIETDGGVEIDTVAVFADFAMWIGPTGNKCIKAVRKGPELFVRETSCTSNSYMICQAGCGGEFAAWWGPQKLVNNMYLQYCMYYNPTTKGSAHLRSH